MNWIITICRNCLPLTRNCLPTLFAQDIGDVQVLVINNACDDGTPAWLRHIRWAGSPVTVVSFPEPRSVAECWNAALQITLARSDYTLVVGNDAELRSDTYRHLVADGGQFVTGVGVSTREQMGEPRDPNPAAKRNHPDYGCYLIRKECFKRVRFDEKCAIAFCEDSIHHVEMHRAGIPAYCIDVPYYHVGSATIKNASREEQRRIEKQADANREYFRSKYGCLPGTKAYEELFA